MKQRSGVLVIVVVSLGYIIAVTQRATMGTAALFATERFQTNAEQLSALAVLQLVVYAGMQIPVGLLLDRIGARYCLVIGALAMALGQITVAFSTSLTTAVIGRMLVGLGDAFTFISMIRTINGWYSGKRASLLQQWLGNLGQLGQVLSAFEFGRIIHEQPWTTAFLSAAGLSAVIAVLIYLVVRDDREPRTVDHKPISFKTAVSQLRLSTKEASTKLAFFTHFSTMSAATALMLLWGVPYLAEAQGIERTLVSTLLSGMVFVGIAAGVGFAHICAHHPEWRRLTVIAAGVANLIGYAGFIFWPGKLPVVVVAILLLLIGVAAPSSMIAFDYSKQYVPKSRLGSTNGFINIGGFLASFSIMFLIGVALDVVHYFSGLPLYSDFGFRVAFVSGLVVVAFGLNRFIANDKKVSSNQD